MLIISDLSRGEQIDRGKGLKRDCYQIARLIKKYNERIDKKCI